MSYQIADKVNGVIGGIFQTEADARVFIDETIAEGMENETNWLLELAHATKEDGAAVNMEDDGYVRRILAAPEKDKLTVAMACARERMAADYTVVLAGENRTYGRAA